MKAEGWRYFGTKVSQEVQKKKRRKTEYETLSYVGGGALLRRSLCSSAIPAYAYSDSGNEEPPVMEEAPAPEPAPTITPGGGFSEDGNLMTRDLLYAAATNSSSRWKPTGGNTLHLSLKLREQACDKGRRSVSTYFLDMVDKPICWQLASLGRWRKLPACSTAQKSVLGAIHTDCEICAST